VHVSIPFESIQPNNSIFVDSCAGASVFSDPRFFVFMEEPVQAAAVYFGPSDPITVTAIGTITFSFMPISGKHAHQRQTVVLRDVYYVPQQHMNLLSVNTLHQHGAGANFDVQPGYVRFSIEGADSFVETKWENNLPYIPVTHVGLLKPERIECHAVRRAVPKDLQAAAMHGRFAHVSAGKLKRLVDAGFLDATDIATCKDLDCDACLTANAQKEKYPTVDYQATYPNHVFHADILYMPETTLDGKDYALIVVDEDTRYVFVALLATRGRAGDSLLTILRRAETLHDKRVKYLRTDLGGEFTSQLMQTAKAELGMQDQHVPAECHSSNGIVERVIKTLQRMVRAMLQASKFPNSFWGEFLLAAAHVYNLLPHKKLVHKTSSIPSQLYLGETDDRMQRLYHQLVPLGIQCSVVDIKDHKPKLDARSQLGYIVGYGPSTQQYRVLVQQDDSTFRHMLVRHVTITGAHHKEFFSRAKPPFDIPSNSAVRRWNPGVADIRARVQAFVSNKTLSIGPNALNKVKQTVLGTDRMLPLFLMKQSFLAGASDPQLNDLACHADPAGFDVDISALHDTFLDPRDCIMRTTKQQAKLFQFIVYKLIPAVCCPTPVQALKPKLTPAEYELFEMAHRLEHSHRALGRNCPKLPTICKKSIHCEQCEQDELAAIQQAVLNIPSTSRERFPFKRQVLPNKVHKELKEGLSHLRQKRPITRSPATSADGQQHKVARHMSTNKNELNTEVKANKNPADEAQSESVATSSLLGHSPESSTKEKGVSSQPHEQLQPAEEALFSADDIFGDESLLDDQQLFGCLDDQDIPEIPVFQASFDGCDLNNQTCMYMHESQPKQCDFTLASAEEQVNCTGDVILEDSGRIRVYNVQASNADDPSLDQALRSCHKTKWLDALQQEIQSMIDSQVFELVDRPKNANVVKCKWVLKIKRKPDGGVDKFKGRLVAKGFSQRHGIDYFDLWSPTGHHATLKCLFVYAVQHDFKVRHVDIKCAFLNGDLEEQVFMEQPPLFNDGTGRVWKLKKSIYGLKQASRQWHKKLKEVLAKLGFKRASYDPALFVDESTNSIFIFMWVDDLFIVAKQADTNRVINGILHEFQGRDLGEASWLLGMEVTHDHKSGILKITQRRMIRNMLERFGFDKKATKPTPVETAHHIVPNPHEEGIKRLEDLLKTERAPKKIASMQKQLEKFKADSELLSEDSKSRYMQIVGSLMYVATVTRPDIMFTTGVLARYMMEPTVFLMRCAERVLLYLAATADFAIVYRRNIENNNKEAITLTAYSDSDHGGDIITRKSTTGMLILFYGNVVYWRSKRQPIVTSSSTEAELVAASATALQLKWLKHLINEDMRHTTKSRLCCDNEATIKLAKDPIASDRTKHIEVKHRKIQELVEEGHMQIQWVSTKDQLADILTKALDRITFEDLRSRIGVQEF
jgi:transposase InsO family protein